MVAFSQCNFYPLYHFFQNLIWSIASNVEQGHLAMAVSHLLLIQLVVARKVCCLYGNCLGSQEIDTWKHITQDFLVLGLLTFWARSSFAVRAMLCVVGCFAASLASTHYPGNIAPVVITNNVSRHWLIVPWGAKLPPLGTTDIAQRVLKI